MNGVPVAVLTVWVLCLTGWGVVLAGIRRGLRGPSRGPALFAHTLTPAGVVLLFTHLGLGSLYGTIAVTAEWWALALVTGLRPERLLDTGGLGRGAAWATAAAGGALLAVRLIF
ncbi:hypothetical protein [Actinomadura roseirufa]|uniref:hypothetical protein n=1 Tax=Actinomadura roseirufa TaxID=2094049 RepID=UPI001F5FCB95|nr:hypothetical protein [Actinomadura roseirufa]